WRRRSVLTDHLPMLRTGRHWETTRRRVNRAIGAVVVVGQESADAFHVHWGDDAPVVVVRNGVRVPSAPLPDRTDGPPRLLFAGRLTDQKNPGFALDVLGALVTVAGLDVSMTVAGDGPLRTLVEARAGSSPIRGRVEVLGFVP